MFGPKQAAVKLLGPGVCFALSSMRIILVSQEYPPETGWGGIGTYMGLHCPALREAGHEVHVLSCVEGQKFGDEVRSGVRIHRRGLLPTVRGAGRLAPQSWRRIRLGASVARALRTLGPFDVLEAPEWMAEGLFVRGTAVVVRLHSAAEQVFAHTGHHGADARAAIALERTAIRRADALIGTVVTVELADGLRQEDIPLREIPYPVPTLAVRPGWTEGPPRIAFVGRFEHRKGPDLLIEALPGLLSRHPSVRLEMIGRDTTDFAGRSVLATLLARARELEVIDAIDIRDEWTDRGVIESALAGIACCVVPSRWESGGFVAAEAVMGGTPTLVSAQPSLEELADHGRGATVVDQATPGGWAEAIASVLEDHARATERVRAWRERLSEIRSAERIASMTLSCYQAAIDHRSTKR